MEEANIKMILRDDFRPGYDVTKSWCKGHIKHYRRFYDNIPKVLREHCTQKELDYLIDNVYEIHASVDGLRKEDYRFVCVDTTYECKLRYRINAKLEKNEQE